jgi:hypothetical protein
LLKKSFLNLLFKLNRRKGVFSAAPAGIIHAPWRQWHANALQQPVKQVSCIKQFPCQSFCNKEKADFCLFWN